MGRGLFTFTVRIFAQEESIENDNRERSREDGCTIDTEAQTQTYLLYLFLYTFGSLLAPSRLARGPPCLG